MCELLSSGVGCQLTMHLFHELHAVIQGRPGLFIGFMPETVKESAVGNFRVSDDCHSI